MSDAKAESAPEPAPLDDVVDRPAASAGLVVAGVALAAAFLGWTDATPLVPAVGPLGSTPGALLAGIAATAFLLLRYGAVDRRLGAWTAGVASAGVVLVALARFVVPAAGGGSAPDVGLGLPVAAVAGAVGIGFAVADNGDASAGRLLKMAGRTAVGFGLIVTAFIVMLLLSLPFAALDLGPFGRLVLNTVLPGPAFVGVAVAFVLLSDRGLDFFDVELPDVRDLAWVGVGIVAVFGGLIVLRAATLVAGLPSTGNSIVGVALEAGPSAVLVLIPLSLVVTGPAEEIFTRNVIQKYLYGAFSRPAAIVVASAVFASGHVFSYGSENPVASFISLALVFVLSMVLGAIYERTENIVVPALVHGIFNAVQFALLYVAIAVADVDPTSVGALVPPW